MSYVTSSKKDNINYSIKVINYLWDGHITAKVQKKLIKHK